MIPALVVALAVSVLGVALAPIADPPTRRIVPADHPGPAGRARMGVATGVRCFNSAGRSMRRRRGVVAPDAVATWCDALARRLRSGATLRDTLLEVVPDDEVVVVATDVLRRRLQRGATIADALASDGPVARGDQHLAPVRAVLSAAADVGGSAAEPLDRAAAMLRLRAADDGERAAQAAQAKLSAKVLTVVPLGALATLVLTDPDVRRVVGSTAGACLVAAGLVLNALGARWMRRIVDGAGSR